MSVSQRDVAAFCRLLVRRIGSARERLPEIAAAGAAYRADPLFEAGADLAEAVVAYADGRVGATALREGALQVAALAALVYFGTVRPGAGPDGGAVQEEGDDGH